MSERIHEVLAKLGDVARTIEPNAIIKDDNEYYFEYPANTYWSISKWTDPDVETEKFGLYLYPKWARPLADLPLQDFRSIDLVSYVESEKQPEYAGQILELYKKIGDRYFGVDDIFNRVLRGY